MNKKEKKKLDQLLKEASSIIENANDDHINQLLGDGIIDRFLNAICLPKANKEQTAYDYLFANKNRLSLLALIRRVITINYSMKGKVHNTDCFVSPTHIQWFDDGVMLVQGKERFGGLIGLYQGNNKLKFGIFKRDLKAPDTIGKDDVTFIDVEEAEKRSEQDSVPKSMAALDKAVRELESLLNRNEEDEEKYQKFLEANPWFLSAQYKSIDSHKNLDDQNIPDFTGVRVRDGARDIIEIKQPFLPLFKNDDKFRSEFNDSWDQAERYLDFTRTEVDYLHRRKGLRFDNPQCYLLMGFGLSENQLKAVRRKERLNPAITVLTFEDLVAVGKSTVNFLKALK